MRVIAFTTSDHKYLAIKRPEDSDVRIPVYKEESDGQYHLIPIFFPSCLKFFYDVKVTGDAHMTTEEVVKKYGDVSALA